MERLCQVLASLSSPDEAQLFLQELLTANERRDVVLRWQLLELLDAGVSQRKIAAMLGISLCKITRGSKILRDDKSVVRRKLKGDKV
ncbi:MAG: Trp family transcriptional regulator [Kiritimatiellae bacterium]|nr:Trp family transcriptional regulator [Kiritimatiellia bacterium]